MDIQSKLGPLPVWAWGLIFGGLAVVWLWVSGRTETPDYSQSVTGESGNLVPSDIAPGGDFSTVPVMPETGETPTPSDTNDDWLRRAVDSVMNSGVSTDAAQRAIQKYLSGETLTTAEEGIVNKAITETGMPPDGTATPNVEPAEPEEPTGDDIDWRTKITVSAPKSVKYGSRHPITATVSWVNPAGHKAKPKGHVTWTVDGQKRGFASYTYASGKVTRIFGFFKSQAVSKDGYNLIRAKFTTAPTQRTKGSVSAKVPVKIN